MRRLMGFTLAITSLFILGAGPASAHHPVDFGPRWNTSQTPTWHFTPSVPSGDWRNRIGDGVRQWNQLGQPLHFRLGADLANRDPRSSCSAANTISIHRFNIDGGGGTLGRSGFCRYTNDSNRRYSSWIIFDSSEEWCLGSGDCYSGFLGLGGGANIDLWSVATHEFGHVASIGHYDGADLVCADNDLQQTMCPAYTDGTERQRTLEQHDKDAFNNKY